MFARIGIVEDLLGAAQVRRVTDAEARRDYGVTFNGAAGGVVFPYSCPLSGNRVTARLRRDYPETDAKSKIQNKYVSPYGDNRHLYFPPGAGALLEDIAVPVAFVESEKAALALTAFAKRQGNLMLIIATGGCWGWKGKTGTESGPNGEREETRGPLPDFGLLALEGRLTFAIFDANVVSNPKVRQARQALAETLADRGAMVRLVDLPELDGVNGPDDFIAAKGDAALLGLLRGAPPFVAKATDTSVRDICAADMRVGQTNAICWPDPLAPEAFHGLAGEILRTIEPHSESV